uniref:Protein translocase subunit SecY n=1 Tax=Anotrichium furcellatum TaxID=41999 RepID=A0A4D6WJ88_9FLOR|nr:SecY-type transporter protein [Anotrichium furcellatum]
MENVKKLAEKTIITLLILLITRIGIFIPVPGIDHYSLNESIQNNSLISFLNFFSGGGFSTIGIFALGIIPYINSSIVIQLLTKILPQLENLQKEEGEIGKQKITQLTRYISTVWAVIQSVSISLWLKPYTFNWNIFFVIECVIALTTGSLIVMWFSEIITTYGIGNGTSLIIFQNIIASIPKNFSYNNWNLDLDFSQIIISVLLSLSILMISIIIQESKRKIIIISVKQLGKINELNPQSYIPLKINQGGVMPIVFASAAITIPSYLIQLSNNNKITSLINIVFNNKIFYLILYSLLVIIFSYLYSSIIINGSEIAKNLKKMGASIPNIRPGSQTIEYLQSIINRLTFIGACFLFIIAQLPFFIYKLTQINIFKGFGITSFLILVGVAIDTAKQIQTYIISEQYDNMIE